MSNSKVVMNCVKRRKSNLIKVLGGKCCICGFDNFQEALEFHHVNPQEKSFGIGSSSSITKSLKNQLEELKKCVLVCSNCHKGIHQGYYQVPQNWQEMYNNEIAEQLLKDNEKIKKHTINYCQYCGKQFETTSTKQKYCSLECASKAQQKSERPPREELKKLIREQAFTLIAKKYNVSDNAIRKWCDSYNLPRKKTEINKYSQEEWEKI